MIHQRENLLIDTPHSSAKDDSRLELSTKSTGEKLHANTKDPDSDNDRPTISLDAFGCKAEFGDGASVLQVTTAFESCTVIVFNVPPNTSRDALIELLESFGHIKNLSLHLEDGSVRVEYMNSSQAAAAVEGLSDRDFRSRTLSARFDLRAVEVGPATLRSTKVKVSWFAPSVIVWAHYDTVSTARAQAKRLDEMMFGTFKLGVTFQMPTRRQHESFSIVIKGLPSSVAAIPGRYVGALKSFTQSRSITLGQLTYDQEVAISSIRVALSRFGLLDSFDVMHTTGKKCVAWAQFSAADEAEKAVKELNDRPQNCLGGKSPLWLEQIHSFKFSLPAIQFAAVQADLDRLRAISDVQCKLRYYDKDGEGNTVDPVCVRLSCSDAKALGRAKAELEEIIQGERLVRPGDLLIWDDFFVGPVGKTFLLNVHKRTGACVKCDVRSRTIQIYGIEEARSRAKDIVLLRFDEIRARRHTIVVEKAWLRVLLSGGFKTMQDELGHQKLVLDIASRTIVVHGDQQDVSKAQQSFERIKTDEVGSREDDDNDNECCPVCFCDASNPTKLPCGHLYDTDCLRHFIKSSITADFQPLRCVKDLGEGQTCAVQVPHSIIRDLITPSEEHLLLEASLRAFMHSRPHEFHYCPMPDCPTVYRPGRAGIVLRCPACLERVCPSCHVEYHEGLSCEEYKDSISENSEMFARWKEANGIKACPGCNADIQKNGGCNHIRCARCKTHICWFCMKSFGDGSSDRGIYDHMRSAHGGIGN